MEKPIASASRTKEILKKYGLHAKKSYGQNFLVDVSLTNRIAEAATGSQAVIEIGPGIGGLTEALCKRFSHVVAYEIDNRLEPVLKDVLRPYENVEIIFEDILKTDIDEKLNVLTKAYGGVNVCANLPYYITTPVIFNLLESKVKIPKITVMVQREVGDRFTAKVNDAQYSALSLEVQYLYDVKKQFVVPASAFTPVPKVDSLVVTFQRKNEKKEISDDNEYFAFLKALFKQRRKTVYNNLREITKNKETTEAILKQAGINGQWRSQQIDQQGMIRLFQATKERMHD